MHYLVVFTSKKQTEQLSLSFSKRLKIKCDCIRVTQKHSKCFFKKQILVFLASQTNHGEILKITFIHCLLQHVKSSGFFFKKLSTNWSLLLTKKNWFLFFHQYFITYVHWKLDEFTKVWI